ncbi:MAG: T9SS type A sorting domain-containing protein [Ignavibacteriales bacterium]|nr:T9SS type A sorting domain-containing protein [Ignavibacteriales bacterium]
MLRRTYTIILAVTLLSSIMVFSQVSYTGPVTGSVSSGAMVNTGTFVDAPIGNIEKRINDKNLIYPISEPMIIENDGLNIFQPTYVEDSNVIDNPNGIGDNTFLIENWNIALDNNVIPPDPTIAVGPNHVMVLTNNGDGIRIYDKQGNLLKLINSTQWWSAVWPSQSGDPQIIYDHYAGRWVMVFMQVDDVAQQAADLIAYSDDSDPFGTWYMYRLPSTLWGDFPQIGFDDEAIYISTNNFSFAGVGQYPKIRIISKAELYASNAGALSYKDIWNISIPNSGSGAWSLRPSFQYSPAGGHYMIYVNSNGGNFYSVYKISNVLTTPTLTGVNISVPFFGPTPLANQLGGGSPLLESGGSKVRNAPIFREGYLYTAHSIRNSVYPNYSSIKYAKIDVASNSVVESAELGANNYFYFYPALAVDKDGNVVITCSRSGDNEYVGAYYTSRRATDPAGLSNSYTLQEGLSNYVKTFGGTRNRWGDYMGIFLDPADEYSFWMLTEYASSGNNYATAVGQVRLQPYSGIYTYQSESSLDFGTNEIGFTSDTLEVILSNYGSEPLIINSIPASQGDFTLVSNNIFPDTLNSFDSVVVSFTFSPSSFGAQTINYSISNNSTTLTGIELNGFGYEMFTAVSNNLYGLSGSQNNNETVFIDKTTGTGTNLGNSNYSDFVYMAVHPFTNQIFGIRTNSVNSSLYRVNGQLGDAYFYQDLDLPNILSIAYDNTGNLFATTTSNELYQIDTLAGTSTLISTMQASRIAIAFNPLNNEIWGSVRNPIGTPKDRIIKVNLATGDTTRIGQTGFGINTTALTFDRTGNLFGVKGTGTTISDLFAIDTLTAVGTLVGSIGLADVKSIGFSLANITSVEEVMDITPADFVLEQNYPNPFNPSTQIKFSLPVNSNVKLVIFNLLGETVREIVNNEMTSGVHTVQWNANDFTGKKVSSGIYFYKLDVNGIDGSEYSQVRKMMLLK